MLHLFAKSLSFAAIVGSALAFAAPASAQDYASWTGDQIMDEVGGRHDADYEFELQTMVLQDSRGNQEERITRRFSRLHDEDLFR